MNDHFDHELDRILNEVKERSDAAKRGIVARPKKSFKEEFETFERD